MKTNKTKLKKAFEEFNEALLGELPNYEELENFYIEIDVLGTILYSYVKKYFESKKIEWNVKELQKYKDKLSKIFDKISMSNKDKYDIECYNTLKNFKNKIENLIDAMIEFKK